MAHYRENREVLQRKGEQSLAFEMMRSKAEPDQFADWLQGPLHLACDSGNSDLVDKLLEAGAGIAAGGIGEDGRTLLHAAAASGNERVVSALLRTPARADINIKSASHAHWRYRGTPLQVAVRGGHESVARTLIAAGADLALALTMAVRRGQERIAYDLLLAGADPNEVDNENGGGDGATPLALAAEQGFEQLVRALLHKGATEPPPRATRVRTAGAVLQSAKSKGPAAAVNPNGKSSISRSRRTRQAAAAADEEKKEELMMPEKNMILMQQRQQERRRLQTQSHKLRKEKKAAAAATALPPLPPTMSNTASPRRATLPLSASSPSPVASRSVVRPPALRTPTPPRISAEERADKKAVSAAAIAWTNAVTSGARDAPRRTAALYAEDGSMWETVSEEVCNTPQQITAYFERFARLPQLRMVEYTPVAARVYGEFAVLAGTYTFAWRGGRGPRGEAGALQLHVPEGQDPRSPPTLADRGAPLFFDAYRARSSSSSFSNCCWTTRACRSDPAPNEGGQDRERPQCRRPASGGGSHGDVDSCGGFGHRRSSPQDRGPVRQGCHPVGFSFGCHPRYPRPHLQVLRQVLPAPRAPVGGLCPGDGEGVRRLCRPSRHLHVLLAGGGRGLRGEAGALHVHIPAGREPWQSLRLVDRGAPRGPRGSLAGFVGGGPRRPK
ncbi:unnamed protein product [Ectocarpus sp. 6 AP-2014]